MILSADEQIKQFREMVLLLQMEFGAMPFANDKEFGVHILKQVLEQRRNMLALLNDHQARILGAVERIWVGCIDGGPFPPLVRYDLPLREHKNEI